MSAKGRSTSAPARPSATQTLLSAEEASATKVSCGRKLARRDTRAQVQKKYWDHFRDFSDYQKFIMVHENQTLDDRLMSDTHACNSGDGPTMGANYYRDLRKWYSVQQAATSQLAAKNPSEEVRAELKAVYKLFKARPKQRRPLLELLKTLDYKNNKECVGLARALLEEDATKGTEQKDFIIGVARWLAANEIPSKEPGIFEAVKSHIDNNLAVIYREVKKEGITLTTFWKVHSEVISMIVPRQDFIDLMTAKGSWDQYERQLISVMTSKFGEVTWSWAQVKIVLSKCDSMMSEFTRTLLEVCSLTPSVVQKTTDDLRKSWAGLNGIDRLPVRRSVKIPYRGVLCDHNVTGLEDELQRRVQAEARGRAAQNKSLQSLKFEESLVGGHVLQHTQLDPVLLGSAAEARIAANEFCAREFETPSGEDFLKIMKVQPYKIF
jgi:hypothetical protein